MILAPDVLFDDGPEYPIKEALLLSKAGWKGSGISVKVHCWGNTQPPPAEKEPLNSETLCHSVLRLWPSPLPTKKLGCSPAAPQRKTTIFSGDLPRPAAAASPS